MFVLLQKYQTIQRYAVMIPCLKEKTATSVTYTPPHKWWLENYFLFEMVPFRGTCHTPKVIEVWFKCCSKLHFGMMASAFLQYQNKTSHKWPINGGNTSWTRHKAEKAKQSQFSCFSRLLDKRWTSLPNDVHPEVKKPFLATTSLDNQPLTKTINLWIQSCKALAPKNWTWRLFNEISITFQTLKRQMPLGE